MRTATECITNGFILVLRIALMKGNVILGFILCIPMGYVLGTCYPLIILADKYLRYSTNSFFFCSSNYNQVKL